MEDVSDERDSGFEAVLLYLKESRGFDFTGYKRTSLARRVRRRMSQVGLGDYSEYIDHLQVNSEEFNALFNTILINVTSFFRDPDAWEFLSSDVVPALLAERSPEDQLRIWSAGALESVPPAMVDKYFERQGDQYVFRKDLRRSVIFGRNDLVQDAPISRIDLLVCRNTLMYFNAETQSKILGRLHFALAPRGLLFLGKAEMLLSPSPSGAIRGASC